MEISPRAWPIMPSAVLKQWNIQALLKRPSAGSWTETVILVPKHVLFTLTVLRGARPSGLP
eukprot:4318411-Amphidinium_carterae.1